MRYLRWVIMKAFEHCNYISSSKSYHVTLCRSYTFPDLPPAYIYKKQINKPKKYNINPIA